MQQSLHYVEFGFLLSELKLINWHCGAPVEQDSNECCAKLL